MGDASGAADFDAFDPPVPVTATHYFNDLIPNTPYAFMLEWPKKDRPNLSPPPGLAGPPKGGHQMLHI